MSFLVNLPALLLMLAATFPAANASVVPVGASLSVDVRLGTTDEFCTSEQDPASCSDVPGDRQSITTGAMRRLVIQWEMRNTGDVPLYPHQLTDTNLGSIDVSGVGVIQPKGRVLIKRLFDAPKTPVTHTFSSTWTAAYSGSRTVRGSDTYQITILMPSLELEVRVGNAEEHCTNPTEVSTCDRLPEGSDEVEVEPLGAILFEWIVTNTGESDLNDHRLSDTWLGDDFLKSTQIIDAGETRFWRMIVEAPWMSGIRMPRADWESEDRGDLWCSDSQNYTITVPAPLVYLDVRIGRALDFCTNVTSIASCADLPPGLDNVIAGPTETLLIQWTAKNIGFSRLVVHSLSDLERGNVLYDYPYVLYPTQELHKKDLFDAPSSTGIFDRSATWSAEDAGGNTNSDSDIYQITVTFLPVELTSFEGRADGARVFLSWRTASESEALAFEVQSAAVNADGDSSPFAPLGQVTAVGSSTEASAYAFTTEALRPGTHRFRLYLIDTDGEGTFSPVVEVEVAVPGGWSVSELYPNPFSDASVLELTLETAQDVDVQLFDALGRPVRRIFNGPLPARRTAQLRVNGSGLASGVYVLRVAGETFAVSRRAVRQE